jgi:hypothetical protein
MSETYTPTATDQGKYLRVRVNRAGYSGTLTSAAAGPVTAADLPVLSGAVSIAETAKVGETLTADTAALDGSGTIGYQWERSHTAASGFADIPGATSGTYTLTAADQGKYLRARVSRAGHSGTITSNPVNVPSPPLHELNVSIGFNYGTITIDGNDEANLMYKTSSNPKSLQLSAAGYDDVKWHIDGSLNPAETGASITLNASDYSVKTHYITFTGKRDGKLYSQTIPFTVKN